MATRCLEPSLSFKNLRESLWHGEVIELRRRELEIGVEFESIRRGRIRGNIRGIKDLSCRRRRHWRAAEMDYEGTMQRKVAMVTRSSESMELTVKGSKD
jgi:hypothetical protein